MNLFEAVIADCIGHDIDVCLKNNAPTGAILLTYCAIDAMSFLSMPLEQVEVESNDFIAWVNKYMKTNSKQPYQYAGIDLYGARCGIAHNYVVESRRSRKGECKIFGYKPNSLEHFYKPEVEPNMVVLGVELFIRDFFDAVNAFLLDIDKNDDLRRRVEARLPNLFRISQMKPPPAQKPQGFNDGQELPAFLTQG